MPRTPPALLLRVFTLALACAPAALAQPPGINAPPGAATVPLSTLEPLDPPALWRQLDGMPFWAIPLAPPPGYYSSADTSSPLALRSTLHDIVDDHCVFPYTHPSRPGQANHAVDTWDIIILADQHPQEPGRILDFYLNATLDRQFAGPTTDPRYDREHTWPKSYGFNKESITNPAYSDCHHLVAAYNRYNGLRSNKPYGEANPDPAFHKPTLENMNRGGGLTDEPDTNNYNFPDLWQVWIGRRGDMARALLYMDIRYEGKANEADLVLTDDASRIVTVNAWQPGAKAYMGLLPVILKWHKQDPVDDLERRRNAVVYLFQQNRNPFVDHPEWVGFIFAGEPIAPVGGGGLAAGAVTPWINEFHYDNEGADDREFVEIAGSAGTDLTGWTVVAYNGSGGRMYKTIPLPAVIPDQAGGFGAVAFDAVGLQNGSPDGLALVDPAGNCVELISYEGHFAATDGPAEGMIAADIGVQQGPTTPRGQTLQRRGQGRSAASFHWEGPVPESRGQINPGQAIN